MSLSINVFSKIQDANRTIPNGNLKVNFTEKTDQIGFKKFLTELKKRGEGHYTVRYDGSYMYRHGQPILDWTRN